MSTRQIEILLENNELDFLIEILKYEQGRAIVFDPPRAAKISEILSKLYKRKETACSD